MIITKTPFRVSIAGGGTDFPSFYENYGPGLVISQAINKYMYVCVSPNFDGKIVASYSVREECDTVDQVKHPIIKHCLKHFKIKSGITVSSIADLPAGSGLGSSSSFTVGLITALAAYKKLSLTKEEIAELAFYIETNKCGANIGKQDQYAAAFGGLRSYTFHKNSTKAGISIINDYTIKDGISFIDDYTIFKDLLFFQLPHVQRDSSQILAVQNRRYKNNKGILKAIKQMTLKLTNTDDRRVIGATLRVLWSLKKQLSPGITTKEIDLIYSKSQKLGAWGGKVCGAGGGGFLMLYVPYNQQKIIKKLGLKQHIFKPDYEGTRVIYDSSQI